MRPTTLGVYIDELQEIRHDLEVKKRVRISTWKEMRIFT
jgi:hypothetical protein